MDNNTVEENNSSDPVAENSPVVYQPKKSNWGLIGIAIFTIALLVLISGFYYGYYRLSIVTKQLGMQLQKSENNFQQTQNNLAQLQKNSSQEIQQLREELSSEQVVLADFKNSQKNNKEGWVIAEAQYLTKLANTNLQVGDNVAVVIKLLQTADGNLRDLADSQVLPIRKALAADIVALQAVSEPDIAGIYLRLSALNNQVNTLSFPNRVMTRDVTATKAGSSPREVWWKQGLQNSWNALQKIVVIRYHNSSEHPLISPDEQDFIYQNLHSMFGQAMWACVHRQTSVYQESLKNIINWVNKYFVTDSPVAKEILNNANELLAINLNPDLPNLSASLESFHNYLSEDKPNSKPDDTTAIQPSNKQS